MTVLDPRNGSRSDAKLLGNANSCVSFSQKSEDFSTVVFRYFDRITHALNASKLLKGWVAVHAKPVFSRIAAKNGGHSAEGKPKLLGYVANFHSSHSHGVNSVNDSICHILLMRLPLRLSRSFSSEFLQGRVPTSSQQMLPTRSCENILGSGVGSANDLSGFSYGPSLKSELVKFLNLTLGKDSASAMLSKVWDTSFKTIFCVIKVCSPAQMFWVATNRIVTFVKREVTWVVWRSGRNEKCKPIRPYVLSLNPENSVPSLRSSLGPRPAFILSQDGNFVPKSRNIGFIVRDFFWSAIHG